MISKAIKQCLNLSAENNLSTHLLAGAAINSICFTHPSVMNGLFLRFQKKKPTITMPNEMDFKPN